MNKGIFCISLDTELLWGRHDLNYEPFIQRVNTEREVIKRMLDLFSKYKVPVTWAIVGHLFLNKCSKEGYVAHPGIKRPKPNWVQGDWFINDPSTNLEENPQWYGTDIIELIQSRKNHEIGSHSFSHIIFGDFGTSKEAALTDIRECVKLAKKNKIRLNSFVFPRNSVGHLSILKKFGFIAFRGPEYNPSKKQLMARLYSLLDLFSIIPIKINMPTVENGLINIPSSMYFVSARGIRKYIPVGLRASRAKHGIDLAIRQGGIFHLWTHPTDLTDNTDSLMKDFEDILKYASEQRKLGKLEISTMGGIAQKFI